LKAAFRIRDTHPAQQLDRAVSRLVTRHVIVAPDCLDQLIPDRDHRVQRCHRILEDHRDVLAADPLHLALGQGSEITPHEADGATDDLCRRVRQQPHDRQRRQRLATAGFTDDGESLAGRDCQRQAIDRRQHATAREQRYLQVFDREDWRWTGFAAHDHLSDPAAWG
jgi:hypothetical protein